MCNQPPSNEQLCARAQAGDEKARAELIDRNLGLFKSAVKKWHVPGYDAEDLLSEAYLAALRAIETFDPGRGSRWSTWCVTLIQRHLSNLKRNATAQKRHCPGGPLSLDEVVGYDEDGCPRYRAECADPYADTESEALLNLILEDVDL